MQSTLVNEFSKSKSSGGTFEQFREQHSFESHATWVQIIAEDQRTSDELRRVETYLELLPDLREDSESVLEAIYSEWLIREERGETIELEDYLVRFPGLVSEIRRQFQLHEVLRVSEEEVDTSVDARLTGATLQADGLQAVGRRKSLPPIPEFEDLQIEGLAGSGGMGAVFCGHSTTLDRAVAVKVLSKSVQADSSESRRMEREARVVASLDDPHVVKVYDVRRDARGLPVILMELVDGGTLAQRLAGGPLSPKEAASMMVKISSGVAAAHQSGLIHRDLKPANILLNKAGEPKVADFGLARVLIPSSIDESSMMNFVGTPSYVSPEQARAEQDAISEASDVYSLGVILYETLTGRPPFQGATAWEVVTDILNQDAPQVRQLNRRVPVDLETICHRCLERSPQQRYPSAIELRNDLQRFLDGKPILAKRASFLGRTTKWVRRNPVPTVAASIVLIALLSTTVVSLLSRQRVGAALANTSAALDLADRRRDVAVSAMNDLVYTVHDQLQAREASIEARGEVLQSAITGLQKIIDSDPDDEKSQLTMADAENRFAFILSQQSRNEEATAEYEKAIRRTQAIEGSEARQLMATVQMNLGQHYSRLAQFEPSIDYSNRALATISELLESDPDNQDLLRLLCTTKNNLCVVYSSRGELAKTLEIAAEIQPIAKSLLEQTPGNLDLVFLLADIEATTATTKQFTGDLTGSMEAHQRVIDLMAPLHPESTEMVAIRTRYFNALMEKSSLQLSQQLYQPSILGLETVAEEYQRLIDAEPQRAGFRLRMGTVRAKLSEARFATDEFQAAEAHARECIAQLSKAIEMNPANDIQRGQISAAWARIADIQLRGGDATSAGQSWNKVIENIEPLVERFQMQGLLSYFQDLSSVMDRANGKETDQSDADVRRFRRSLLVMHRAHEEDFKIFLDNQQRLLEDIDQTQNASVRMTLAMWLAIVRGRYYESLVSSNESAKEVIDQAAKDCIAAIERYLRMPDSDRGFLFLEPSFISLRKSSQFREAVEQATAAPN